MLEFRRCGWLPALGSRFRSSSDAGGCGLQASCRGLGSDAAMNVVPRLGDMSDHCACTCGCLRAIALSPRIRIYSAIVGSLLKATLLVGGQSVHAIV